MTDDEEVALAEGMAVKNPDDETLGTLSALLIEEDEEQAEFLLLGTEAGDRLVPFEAVLGVHDGKLVLDVPKDSVARFPSLAHEAEPTEAQMDQAYETYDETAGQWDDEDEEE